MHKPIDTQTGRPERHKRGLRLLLIVAATTLASAAIGFGGLAAWSVTTQNNGNAFATGNVHHSNKATSNITVTNATGASVVATCTDLNSPGNCGVIINVSNAKPGASASGSVKIVNIGNLQSGFTVNFSGAPTGVICGDLTLQIVDNEATPATVALGAPLMTVGGSPNFNPTDTGTYTFTVTLSPTAPQADMGGSCAAGFAFTQTNT